MGNEARKAVRKARKRQKKSDKARDAAGLPMRPELFIKDSNSVLGKKKKKKRKNK